MSQAIIQKANAYLSAHNVCTVATTRADGSPQANTVEYVSDGLTLYVATDPAATKVENVRRDCRVAVTVDEDYSDWSKIQGVQFGGTAEIVSGAEEQKAGALYIKKFPAIADYPETEMTWLKLTPKILFWLDYTVDFGHKDMVKL
jgi:PPOX class probable F420-dependent enzyme